MSVRFRARFPTPEERVALEARLAAARRRLRVANISLYVGFLAGAGGLGGYLAAASARRWWVAALILVLPLLAGIFVSRRIVRNL